MDTSRGKHVCSFDDCSMTFNRPSRLKQHLRTHTGDRPYLCDHEGCDKEYTRAAHLKRHMDTAHTSLPKPAASIRCTESDCDKIYSSEASLKKHIETIHHGDLRYKCDIEDCGQAFRKRHQLKAHQYEHKGVLPFQCSQSDCLRRFLQKSHLDRHMKSHEGYQCPRDGCEEIFTKFSLLRKHKVVCHTEVICTECGKMFHSHSWLQQHKKTHSDSRDLYQCPEDGCPRAYLDMRNLQTHLRSYHEEKSYHCQEEGCTRAFATNQKLLQHSKLHDPAATLPKNLKKSHRKKGVKHLVKKLTGVDPTVTVDSMDTEEVTTDSEQNMDHVISTNQSCDSTTVTLQKTTDICNNNIFTPSASPAITSSDKLHSVALIQMKRLDELYGPPVQSGSQMVSTDFDEQHGRL